VYELCLIKEFELRGIKATSQITLPLIYKGYELSKDFKIDILVENEIIIELKSVEIMLPVFEAQIISYLKLANKRLGFLINFNVPLLKQGFKRFVNNF
ncbi:MAG: GxxExxY protein, partial [Ignavibacteriaceae bacterium]|nr:GxxExxY protein [Ignavibacteriaceae bacterium]